MDCFSTFFEMIELIQLKFNRKNIGPCFKRMNSQKARESLSIVQQLAQRQKTLLKKVLKKDFSSPNLNDIFLCIIVNKQLPQTVLYFGSYLSENRLLLTSFNHSSNYLTAQVSLCKVTLELTGSKSKRGSPKSFGGSWMKMKKKYSWAQKFWNTGWNFRNITHGFFT